MRHFIQFILVGPGNHYLISCVILLLLPLLLVFLLIYLIVKMKKHLTIPDQGKYYNGVKTSNTLCLLVERGLRNYSQVNNNTYVNNNY